MNTQIDQLRALVASRFPTAMQTDFSRPSHVNGGVELVPGALVEIVATNQVAGAGLLLLHVCNQAVGPVALVDANDALDLAAIPVELRNRLLWLRGHGVGDSLKATDLLLRDGNLSSVLLDLRQVPLAQLSGVSSSVWHRLRMLAERAHAGVMIFTSHKAVGCAAVRWLVSGAFRLNDVQEEQGGLLGGLNPICQRGFGYTAPRVGNTDLSLQS